MTSSTSDSRRFTEKTSRPKVWFYGLLVVLLSLFALPFVTLVFLALTSSFSSWPHLVRYILPQTTLDTALLLLLVAAGSSIVGIGCAWLTELCEFPGKRFFSWALVLPLSVPTYIAAYCMTELWDFTGPVQSAMRSLFGWQTSRDYWFPDIHSVWGAAFVFTLVLYPYVFLTARLTFSLQGANVLEVARSLGAGPWRVFLTVALPLIRPAAMAGVTLVLFETLNDIGAVEHLGVRTITFAIFETWLNRDDLGGSIQLAVLALVLIVALSALERRSRRKMNFHSGTRDKPVAPVRLNRFQMTLAFGVCSSVLFLGFGVPAFVLAQYLSRRIEQIFDTALIEIIWNTASVSLLAALIAVGLAYLILVTSRISQNSRMLSISRVFSFGYAIPGTVLALGLLIPLSALDNALDGVARDWFDVSTGLLFTGGIAALTLAYCIRFLTIGWNTLESSLSRLSMNIDLAARGLGRSAGDLVREIHTPILARSLAVAALLVFVETTKELSATLLLRPFGFETLATTVYSSATQAAVEDAAAPAFAIIILGLLPLFFVARQTASRRQKKAGLRPA